MSCLEKKKVSSLLTSLHPYINPHFSLQFSLQKSSCRVSHHSLEGWRLTDQQRRSRAIRSGATYSMGPPEIKMDIYEKLLSGTCCCQTLLKVPLSAILFNPLNSVSNLTLRDREPGSKEWFSQELTAHEGRAGV